MFSIVTEGLNSIPKSSKVCGDGFSIGFGEEGVYEVGKITDFTTEIKEGLTFFLAAFGVF